MTRRVQTPELLAGVLEQLKILVRAFPARDNAVEQLAGAIGLSQAALMSASLT
jgi:hypothetical protein